MSIPRGNVVIVPAVDRTINLMPAGTSPLPPDRGLTGGPLIKWNIKAVDDTGFTLYVFSVAGQPDRTLSILEGQVVVSTSQPAVKFAMERAGTSQEMRIRVPGKDEYWRMEAANVPVSIGKKDSSLEVQWLIAVVP